MSKCLIHRADDGTTSYLQDTRLSLQAWGLLSFLLVYGETTSCSIENLSKISKTGNTAVRSALTELKQLNYLVITPLKNEMGRIYDWQYDIFESTISLSQYSNVPLFHNSTIPLVEKPHVEHLYNNTDSSTENNINNNSSNSTTSNISITAEKEEKKIYKRKDEKKFDLSFVGIAYADAFNMWLEHKRKTRDAYKTQQGIELCYRKLLEYSNNDPNTFTRIIEQSIANNWKGLYELKDNNQNNARYGRNGFNDPEETMRCIIAGFQAADAERGASQGTL